MRASSIKRNFHPSRMWNARKSRGGRGGVGRASRVGNARARERAARVETRARARARADARARLADATRGFVKLAPRRGMREKTRQTRCRFRKARENWSAGAPSGIEGCASAGDVAEHSSRPRTVREVGVDRVALDARLRTARARDLRPFPRFHMEDETRREENVVFHDVKSV